MVLRLLSYLVTKYSITFSMCEKNVCIIHALFKFCSIKCNKHNVFYVTLSHNLVQLYASGLLHTIADPPG